MADNDQRQTHGDMLNDLMQEEFKAWANVHDDLTPEQLSRLESAYKETGEIQDIELAYSEMRRKGETQQSDFRDWVEAHPDLSAEDITRLHGIYQQTHDTSDLDLSYSVTHGNKEEAAKEQTGTEDNVQPATNNGNDGENNNQPNNDANTNQAGLEQEANTPSNGQPQEIMTVEQAVRLAQANREEAEREVEAAKKKMDALVKSDKEVKAFVQSLGSADELLPDTGMLETARSYRAGKALPVIKKLVRKLREVYALLVNERQKNTDMLRETAYWKRKAEHNDLMQEKASKLDRLTRTPGADEIDRLLSQRSTHEHSRYKAWETNR